MHSDRAIIKELIVHAIAFCIVAALAAAILYRYYPFLEHHTDDAGQAREAFLASVFIAGGAGPAITLAAFWLVRAIRGRKWF